MHHQQNQLIHKTRAASATKWPDARARAAAPLIVRLACFRDHGDRCSEGFFKERVKAALAEEPQKKARWVGDLLKGAPSPDIDEAQLLQLLDGSVQPTKAEEQLVLRAIANGELESEPWAPWWRDWKARLDDDLADCASKYDALSSEALRDADAARTVIRGRTTRGTNGSGTARAARSTRARVLALVKGAAPLAPRLGAVRCRACRERRARLPRQPEGDGGARALNRERALRVLRRRARLRRVSSGRGRRGDAWLAACPAVARDERPETVAAAHQCGAAGH